MPGIIFIDHYDSFADILMDYFKRMDYPITRIFTDQINLKMIRQHHPSAIVIGPGYGHPLDAELADVYTVIEYYQDKLPILGVCLGHQIVAQYYHARIIKAPRIMHGRISNLKHQGTDIFQQLPEPLSVTRYHSLAIQPDTLVSPLKLTGWTHFGQHTEVMGIAHQYLPIYGVQFHPEAICTDEGIQMIQNFMAIAHK